MKFRTTGLFFVVTNIIFIVFRIFQVTAMTTRETTFIKEDFTTVSIVAAAVGLLLLVANFVGTLRAQRVPESIKFRGFIPAVVCFSSAFCFLLSGVMSLFDNTSYGKGLIFVFSLVATFTLVLYGQSATKRIVVPKFLAISFTLLWLCEFILSYLFYVTSALRVRTVLETLAMVALILFFLSFGKAQSGVKSQKNVRFLFPLGLVASTLCFVSVVPEVFAIILGFTKNVSVSSASEWALFGAGIFTAFVSLDCAKKTEALEEKHMLVTEDVIEMEIWKTKNNSEFYVSNKNKKSK